MVCEGQETKAHVTFVFRIERGTSTSNIVEEYPEAAFSSCLTKYVAVLWSCVKEVRYRRQTPGENKLYQTTW